MNFISILLITISSQCVWSFTTTDAPLTSGPVTSGPPTSGPLTSGSPTSGPQTSGPQTSESVTSGVPSTVIPETSVYVTTVHLSSEAPQTTVTEDHHHTSSGSTEATTHIEMTTDGTLSFCRELIWNTTGNDPFDNYPTYPDNGSTSLNFNFIIFIIISLVFLFV